MVGDCLCEIEALDPQESAIIKMSTVFKGPFSVNDLAAGSKSRRAQLDMCPLPLPGCSGVPFSWVGLRSIVVPNPYGVFQGTPLGLV